MTFVSKLTLEFSYLGNFPLNLETSFCEVSKLKALFPNLASSYVSKLISDFENPFKKSETKPRRFALLTKGADSAVFARLADKEKHKLYTAEGHVNRFARDGLRTLAFGRRYLTEEETIKIRNKIIEAEASVSDSSNQLQEIYKEIETDLEFLGLFLNSDWLR